MFNTNTRRRRDFKQLRTVRRTGAQNMVNVALRIPMQQRLSIRKARGDVLLHFDNCRQRNIVL